MGTWVRKLRVITYCTEVVILTTCPPDTPGWLAPASPSPLYTCTAPEKIKTGYYYYCYCLYCTSSPEEKADWSAGKMIALAGRPGNPHTLPPSEIQRNFNFSIISVCLCLQEILMLFKTPPAEFQGGGRLSHALKGLV